MKDYFKLEIVSLDGKVWDDDCTSLSVPTIQGEITILRQHAALVSDVVPGELKIKLSKEQGKKNQDSHDYFAVGLGLIEVNENKVIVLLRDAVYAHQLEEKEILEAKRRAEETLKEYKEKGREVDDVRFASATAHLEKALAGLKVLKWRRRH